LQVNAARRAGAIVCALIAALVMAPPLARATEASQTSADYEDGLAAFNGKHYRTAIIHLKNALQDNPENIPARILIGRSYLLRGDAVSAEQELTRARKAGADDALTIISLADAYYLQRKFAELLKNIKGGRRAPRVEAAIMLRRGLAYVEVGKLDRAEAALTEVIGLRPDSPAPMLGLAKVRMIQGDFEAAAASADDAIALAPGNVRGWYLMGEIHRRQRALEDAVRSYGQAIKIRPGHLPSRLGRAATLIDLGRHDRASRDIEVARSLARGDPTAGYLYALVKARDGDERAALKALSDAEFTIRNYEPDFVATHPPTIILAGLIAYAQQNFDDARSFATQYVAKEPNNPGGRKFLGTLLLRIGQPAEAIEALEPALEVTAEDPRLLALLGTALLQNGNSTGAETMLSKAAELAPDVAWIRAQHARSQIASGHSGQAVGDLELALSLDPGDDQLTLLLALVQLERGRYDDALAIAETMIAAQPNDPFPHDIAGAALIGGGDSDKARSEFRKAIEIDRQYYRAQSHLAQLDQNEGNLDGAKAFYLAMMDADPTALRPMLELAKIAEAQERLEDAIKWLDKARSFYPGDTGTHLRLIDLHIRADQSETAMFLARKLRAANPSDLAILEALGRAELAVGAPERAAETFLQMVHIARYSSKQLYRIARLQLSAQDYESARATLEKALLSGPDFTPALAALVQLEAPLGQAEEALTRVARYRTTEPNSVIGDRLAGDVLMRMGRFDKALDAYETAFQRESSTALVLRLYLAHREAGNATAGIRVLESWLAGHDDDRAAHRALAAGYMDSGRLEQAIAYHERINDRWPGDPVIVNNLAWLYQRASDPRALTYAEQAHALAPEQPEILDTLGWSLVRQGEAGRGLTLLREAFARESTRIRTRYHIAVALDRLGRPEEARKELEAVLQFGSGPLATSARKLLNELSAR
jgi:putative PEP-CTERM system TPR-repeat lipoprotein